MQTYKPFKEKYSIEQRKAIVERHICQTKIKGINGQLFVVLEPSDSSKDPLKISQIFIIKKSVSVRQFLKLVRKRFKLRKDKSLFLFHQNKVLVPVITLQDLSDRDLSVSSDGILYLKYSNEQTFGFTHKLKK